MGLLDMIIGWFFFTQIWGLLSTIPRRGVFSFFTHPGPKRSYLIKRIISGPICLKIVDILVNFIIFRVPSFGVSQVPMGSKRHQKKAHEESGTATPQHITNVPLLDWLQSLQLKGSGKHVCFLEMFLPQVHVFP